MPNVNTVNFGMNADYAAEQEQIARQKAIALALQQQSMQPLESQTASGGLTVPTSPMLGVAKMVQALMGQRGMDKAMEQQKALSGRYQTGVADALTKYLALQQGTPERTMPPTTPNDDEGNAMPNVQMPATKGDPRAAIMYALSNQYMQGNPLVASDMKRLSPDWKVEARFNPANGREEKVLVNVNNPAETKPFGGTKAPHMYPMSPGQSLVPEPPVQAQGSAPQPAAPNMPPVPPPGPVAPPAAPGAALTLPTAVPPQVAALQASLRAAGVQEGSPQWQKAFADLVAKESTHRPPNSVRVSVDTKAETEYAKGVSGKAVDRDSKLYDAATAAIENKKKLDEVINHLKTSDAVTGLGAELMLNAQRLRKLVTDSKAAGKAVSDTQLLDAYLGSDVFPMIQGLGIGARGMDTPAEREYLRQVMTGTITMDKAALIKMTEIRRDIAQRALDKWNSRVKSGEMDDFFKYSKIPKATLDVPASPTDTPKRRASDATPRVIVDY